MVREVIVLKFPPAGNRTEARSSLLNISSTLRPQPILE